MASSTMRLSGLISGMDTESIIKQLVSAKQTKVDDAKKAQTKLEWKTTAWEGSEHQAEESAVQIRQQYAFYQCLYEEDHIRLRQHRSQHHHR